MFAEQHRLVDARIRESCLDHLLLLEHDPIFTVGRNGPDEHWQMQQAQIAAAGIPIQKVDRGGSVTYHGPGQLVGYPIMKLRPPILGPKAFVRAIEFVLINTLAEWGLVGYRRERLHGVWVGHGGQPHKIAAVGIRLVRGVTMHGFALNVTNDLTPFSWIVPCGIDGCRVASMKMLLDTPPSCREVAARVAAHMAEQFHLQWVADPGHVTGSP